MGTRYPPHDNRGAVAAGADRGRVPLDAVMNSLPHYELFSMALDHLVRWVADGVVPPRAERIEVGPDGWFAADEHGNSLGGVRCPEMDVPRDPVLPQPQERRRHAGVRRGRHRGGLRPRDAGQALPRPRRLRRAVLERRLDELIAQGWLLPEDADEIRGEAEKADVP